MQHINRSYQCETASSLQFQIFAFTVGFLTVTRQIWPAGIDVWPGQIERQSLDAVLSSVISLLFALFVGVVKQRFDLTRLSHGLLPITEINK